MADKEGPQAPAPQGAQGPPDLQNPPPPQNPQIPIVPNAPQVPEAPHLSAPHIPPLNWSPFKPEYSDKPAKMQKLTYLGQTTGWTHMC